MDFAFSLLFQVKNIGNGGRLDRFQRGSRRVRRKFSSNTLMPSREHSSMRSKTREDALISSERRLIYFSRCLSTARYSSQLNASPFERRFRKVDRIYKKKKN